MLRVALCGEEGAGLQTARMIAEAGAQLVGVCTTPASSRGQTPLAAFATNLGAPVWPPELLRTPSFAGTLADAAPDLLLNVHSLVLLPAALLQVPRIGAFNLHPGPLPEYAGLSCPSWAVRAGATRYGVTLHWMVPDVDAGPIADSREFEVADRETGLSLSARCVREGLPLVRELLRLATERPDDIPRRPQREGARQLYPRRPADGLRLDWNASAIQLDRLIRAADYAPFPSPWGVPTTSLVGRSVGVLKASVADATAVHPMPGRVLALEDSTALVTTACGVLRLERMTSDRGPSSAAAILRQDDHLGTAVPA